MPFASLRVYSLTSNGCNSFVYFNIIGDWGFHTDDSLIPRASSSGLLIYGLDDCDKAPIIAPFFF